MCDPESTYESAVFGHLRGAFTGAAADHDGLLALANGGTSFFDEIGGLPWMTQAKLLRALDTKEFYPVGARMARRSDFRIVSATNESVEEMSASGTFRPDLMYRLRGAEIVVPALEERREDIPELVTQFASHTAGTAIAFTAEAIELFQEAHWPGNVRQLRHVVELLMAMADRRSPTISAADVIAVLRPAPQSPAGEAAQNCTRRQLVDVLHRTGWDTLEASALLGVNRATVYRRMKRFGVAVPDPVVEQLRSRARGSAGRPEQR